MPHRHTHFTRWPPEEHTRHLSHTINLQTLHGWFWPLSNICQTCHSLRFILSPWRPVLDGWDPRCASVGKVTLSCQGSLSLQMLTKNGKFSHGQACLRARWVSVLEEDHFRLTGAQTAYCPIRTFNTCCTLHKLQLANWSQFRFLRKKGEQGFYQYSRKQFKLNKQFQRKISHQFYQSLNGA